ncbi:hypothetical protein ACW9UM_00115 [Marinovum sp. KMM 9989]
MFANNAGEDETIDSGDHRESKQNDHDLSRSLFEMNLRERRNYDKVNALFWLNFSGLPVDLCASGTGLSIGL